MPRNTDQIAQRVASRFLAAGVLGRPNTYWMVTAPFRLSVATGDTQPTGQWYGASQLFEKVYQAAPVKAGDEIHNLYGGIYLVQSGVGRLVEEEGQIPSRKISQIGQGVEARYV